jgi:hypothetical protein
LREVNLSELVTHRATHLQLLHATSAFSTFRRRCLRCGFTTTSFTFGFVWRHLQLAGCDLTICIALHLETFQLDSFADVIKSNARVDDTLCGSLRSNTSHYHRGSNSSEE